MRIILDGYSNPSPAFYVFKENERMVLQVMWSTTGVKMGDNLGSLLFQAVHTKKVIRPLQESAFGAELEMTAVIDDLNKLWKCPDRNATEEEWEDFYDKMAELTAMMDRLGGKIGIRRVPEKGVILIKEYMPLPKSMIRRVTNGEDMVSIKLNVRKEGIIVCGCPVGSQSFIEATMQQKVDDMDDMLMILQKLGDEDAQMATRILGFLNQKLDYVAGTIDFRAWSQVIESFQLGIEETQLQILNPVREAGPRREEMSSITATTLFELPTRMGGFGLTKLWNKAIVGQMVKLMSSAAHPLTIDRPEVQRDLVGALYEQLQEILSRSDIALSMNKLGIPGSAEEFVIRAKQSKTTHYQKHNRLTAKLLFLIHAATRLELRKAVMQNEGKLSSSDVIRILTATSRSMATRVLEVDLGNSRLRVDTEEFRQFFSFYCGILKQRNGRPFELSKDGEVGQKCSCGSDGLLTWDGAHAALCDQGKCARARLHTNINKTVQTGMSNSRLEVQLEPSTSELLENKVAKETLQRMFNKRGLRSKKVQEILERICSEEAGRDEARDGLRKIWEIVGQTVQDAKGLRLDGRAALSSKRVLTWDSTVVHPLAASYRKKAKAFCIQEVKEEMAAIKESRVNKLQKQVSRVVVDTVVQKVKKYMPLIDLCNAMHKAYLVRSGACFLVFAISTLGEMSNDVFWMVDYLAARERHAAWNRSREDGMTPGQMAAACKRFLMDKLMVDLVKGWGNRLGMVR